MKLLLSKLTTVVLTIWLVAVAQAADPLSSWNDGSAKEAILSFVSQVTDSSRPTYVEAEERIATFDQDGTLWVEHPIYTQALFALDRVADLAPKHPQRNNEEPFKSVLSKNQEAIARFTEQDWARIIAVTHAGITITELHEIVTKWLEKAKHPRFKRRFTDLVYQPMLELMEYLRANGFKTYIVTGGGQEFVRVYAQTVYGISPEQVVGSSFSTKYEYRNDKPVLMQEPKEFLVNNYAGKPVGINLFIGKRPRAAFGNSDGDREMLEWTTAGDGARLGMLVLHDDAEREYAYGPAMGLPDSKVGTFPQALYDEAKKKGWVVISMKTDWKRMFPADNAR